MFKKIKKNFLSKSLNEFYASVTLRQFGLALIEIFIPIFLINLGFSFKDVILLFLFQSIVHILYVPIVVRISSKIGFKKGIVLGIPFTIYSFYLLFSLNVNLESLFIYGIFKEIGSTMFYMSYHVLFAKYTTKDKRGSEVSILDILISTLSILSPVIGGLLISQYGMNYLLILVGVILILSSVPLFFSKDYKDNSNIKLLELFKLKNKKYFIAFFGHGIENMMDSLVWPVFIFFSIYSSYIFLGFSATLITIFSIIFTFFVGKYTNNNKNKALRIGAITSSIIWFIKYFINTSFGVSIINGVKGFSQKLTNIPFNVISYQLANEINIISFLLYREIVIHLGRIFLYLIILVFIVDIKSIFFLGILANITYLYLNTKEK